MLPREETLAAFVEVGLAIATPDVAVVVVVVEVVVPPGPAVLPAVIPTGLDEVSTWDVLTVPEAGPLVVVVLLALLAT